MNLVRNAVKFTTTGFIFISTTYEYEYENLSICVQDTGAGIEQKDIGQIFTRFGKLQRTAEMNSEGLGLGLTIVK